MRLLVCGGRYYGYVNLDPKWSEVFRRKEIDLARRQKIHVYTTLDRLHAEQEITHLINGGATGTDWCARNWAEKRSIPTLEFKPDWNAHGPAAGPIRNQQMVEAGPELVVAFPGTSGTADMVWRARARGVRVLDLRGEGVFGDPPLGEEAPPIGADRPEA